MVRVVIGEMGIGKTALVDTFVSELPEDARVFRVECSPVKIDLPYATVSDLLREMTGVAADDPYEDAVAALRAILTKHSSKSLRTERVSRRLAELITARQVELQDEDAAQQHHSVVVSGLRLLFRAFAMDAAEVLIIDGVQWADRASLKLLKSVLARSESLPVLVLLVCRPDERLEPFAEGMMRTELGGLGSEEQIRARASAPGRARGGGGDMSRAASTGGRQSLLLARDGGRVA